MPSNVEYQPPNTAAELVAAYDRGEAVPSIELGGLGPGYEQAIQELVIELLRSGDAERFEEVADAADKAWGGFSGAQIGVAKSLARRVLKLGMKGARLEVSDPSREILICNAWSMKASAEVLAALKRLADTFEKLGPTTATRSGAPTALEHARAVIKAVRR